jgi:hypothetical protein
VLPEIREQLALARGPNTGDEVNGMEFKQLVKEDGKKNVVSSSS